MINFVIDKEDLKKFEDWNKKHKCKLKKNSGAIGGRLSFNFTPTGLGLVIKVKCGCGAEVDLSRYEDW
jgi:hypothetical protein